MVNDKNNLYPIIEEQFLMAKTGRPEDCEDSIYIGKDFVAVIDGATSKTIRRWNGETTGRTGARIIKDVFSQLPCDATAYDAADLMTSAVKDFYIHRNILEIVTADPVQRLTASVVALSVLRKEIWFIGDCQCLLNGECISHDKVVDRIASEARALFLQAELLRGTTVETLEQNDLGREFILPLLKRMMLFQNEPSTGEYWYPVIDGFAIPHNGIVIREIPHDVDTIVLATDGYPVLKSSLEETERALYELLLNDPLLCYQYKSTKGLRKGNLSFDDRAYIKVRIQAPN